MSPVPFCFNNSMLQCFVGSFGGRAGKCGVGGSVCLGALIVPPAHTVRVWGTAGFKGFFSGHFNRMVKVGNCILEVIGGSLRLDLPKEGHGPGLLACSVYSVAFGGWGWYEGYTGDWVKGED